MVEWWSNLTALNQVFYGAAAFFSVIFLWQFIASLMGLSGSDVDVGGDGHIEVAADHGDVGGLGADHVEVHAGHDVSETVHAFKVLSVRAILAFCTLFAWAAALYLDSGKGVSRSLLYAIGWGFAGWLVVTLLINWIQNLAETGNPNLATCVGARGTVYLDIPAGGQGEVRVPVCGVISMVRARTAGGEALKAGRAVIVTEVVDKTTLRVQPEEPQDRQEQGKEDKT